MINQKHQHGFIALISAIVISFLLIAITVSLGFSGFFGRSNISDSESKERSLALAESCADTAILNLANDPNYNPNNDCVSVGDTCPSTGQNNVCSIISKQVSGNQVTFMTQAVINKAYSYIKVVIDSSDFSITSWGECSTTTSC